ncbi:MAG: NAD-dependent epimerase/dehydratase family protein, partial [Roseburia sp.]|nr:NAD-dependent epimerase/dehydratase family protein [Roseburia sp.]
MKTKRKMIITGVNGFLGRSAREYFEKDYDITGIDLAAKYCGGEDSLSYYQCNMSQEAAELASIFTSVQPDAVLHCAGSANVGASVVNPMADLDGNLHSLYQLLLALKSFEKRPEIIFFSSSAVYGNPKQLPMRESDEPAPISPYGIHKLMAEQLCSYYNRVHGYHIRSIRILSAYGSGLRKQILWDIYQKYRNTGKIELFGTGNETRDFIHVSDILQAIELILAYRGPEEIFNVANGEEVSIRELAETYARILGESKDIVTFNGETKP